jgi:hypothetical protein
MFYNINSMRIRKRNTWCMVFGIDHCEKLGQYDSNTKLTDVPTHNQINNTFLISKLKFQINGLINFHMQLYVTNFRSENCFLVI